MKKPLQFFALAVVFVLMAWPVYGASLSYNPDYVNPTIEAGAEFTVPMAVTIQDIGFGTYYMWFVNDVLGGNLPPSWIQVTPVYTFVGFRNPTDTALVTIRVPAGTAPGVYSGLLHSRAMAGHELADPGSGLRIVVTVPSRCSAMPTFEITAFGPNLLWPPNHSMVQVNVSGRAVLPDGCTLRTLGYSIVDEYGVYTSAGTLTVPADGNFSVPIPVEAWRNGNDMDGRHYTITLSAEDEAGIGSSGALEVLVPHDMRDKVK